MNWNIEPYQQQVYTIQCKYCGDESDKDFCSQECGKAYWSEMD